LGNGESTSLLGALLNSKPRHDTLCKSLEVEISARFVSRAGCNVRPTVPLLPALFGEVLVERTKIDHNSLVGPAADLLIAVACRHFEVNSVSLDVDYLGRRRTSWPTGVAAKCFTSTAVPTALSPASKNGLIALSAAFSMIRIIMGVASTCGNMASLNRLARCSGCTRNADVPLAPNRICRILSSSISSRRRFTPNRSTKADTWPGQSWVNRVTLTARRSVPVFHDLGHGSRRTCPRTG
jgi:hypothetical protein